MKRLRDRDYHALAQWRHALRRFLSASESITRSLGVSPTQYQLLLFVRGAGDGGPAIAELAERLQVRHQSAVGLVDRCEAAGLVRRRRDPANRRRVLISLTRRGSTLLARLASEHYRTIENLGVAFVPPSLARRPRPATARRPS
ncbi:MAG TPA: MarR family winged helix-turn-helix transcriptional regulator [Thermoanaerobaculia bacterium]|nr:MarR family winged helix-turn-helix transcriptional regulator [Thermoanaerobaculia bacterium]